MKLVFAFLFTCISICTFGQSKKELHRRINTLTAEKVALEQQKSDLQTQYQGEKGEKETLKKKFDRLVDIAVDDVITPDEQPSQVVIGEEGWREVLNSVKYKSDILGQLGTIWVLDTNDQLQPQGAILLSDYKIEPQIISSDNDVLYKKFISRNTSASGDGGIPFAKIAASLSDEDFSEFKISIDGTSLIKPQFQDLRKISNVNTDLFDIENSKGVFLCTGMHVVRYSSRVFSKTDGEGKITSPVVNLNGDFYAENSQESKEFFVARQLTQLFKGTNKDVMALKSDLKNIVENKSVAAVKIASKNYSPEEVWAFILDRDPLIGEILKFQSNPTLVQSILGSESLLTSNELILLEGVNARIVHVPNVLNIPK